MAHERGPMRVGSTPSRFLIAGSWAAVILVLVLAALVFAHGMHGVAAVSAPDRAGSVAVGSPLPDVRITALDGSASSLRAYAGHPLWLNFFATWCVPCKAELPEIEHRYQTDKPAGLVVLGLDQQESALAVQDFTRHYGVTYPVAIDDGPAAVAFQVRTIPLSVFVDAGGTVRAIHIGQMQPPDMDAALRSILR